MIPNIKLFLTSNSPFRSFTDLQKADRQQGFYQQLVLKLTKSVASEHSFIQIGDELIVFAEQAYAFRKIDTVEQVGQALIALPLPERYETIGRYYQALCVNRYGRSDEARTILERVVDAASPRYRAMVMMSMGGILCQRGDEASAWPYYSEALRAASDKSCYDLPTLVQAHRGIAVLKSIDGNHSGALADLENLFPQVRAVSASRPHIYYDYLNSLAVELGAVGRIEEARNASRIATASPFASVYHEWRETSEELALWERRPSRSLLAFTRKSPGAINVVSLPITKSEGNAASTKPRFDSFQQPARILDFQKWKNRMVKKSKGSSRNELPAHEMSARDMLLRIMDLISESGLTDDQLRKMMLAIEAIACGPEEEGQ